MEVYYVNHRNQKIDLGRSPYQMQIGQMFNHSNKYEAGNLKVKRIYKDVTTLPTTVTIDAASEKDFYDAINNFFEITEADTASGVPGKLYIGEWYILCNIISSDKKFWQETFRGMENSIKLLVPYPFWCREVTKSFLIGNESAQEETADEYLFYPIQYPYRYSMPRDVGFIQNDHYAACDFKMTIYGPCTDPSIMVNGHVYEVMTTLYAGDYLMIDSRNNTVIKYKNYGATENMFNFRNKKSSLFEKIPSGRCSVTWNTAAFGFDLTLFQERSEPKWSL